MQLSSADNLSARLDYYHSSLLILKDNSEQGVGGVGKELGIFATLLYTEKE